MQLQPDIEINCRYELIGDEMFFFLFLATEANAGLSRTNSVFSSSVDVSNHMIGKTNFAVPAPPPLVTGEKIRRLSDSEHFRQPNITVGHTTVQKQLQEAQTQAQAQALADMILKVNFYSFFFKFIVGVMNDNDNDDDDNYLEYN